MVRYAAARINAEFTCHRPINESAKLVMFTLADADLAEANLT